MTSVTTMVIVSFVRSTEQQLSIVDLSLVNTVDIEETAAQQSECGQVNIETITGIYDESFPLIYRYVVRRVGDTETARDLTSEVFSRFLDASRQGGASIDSPTAWLYRTAHNAIIDHFRRQAHRQHLQLDENIQQPGAGPEAAAEDRILASSAREALALLTPDQQQVISLRFLEGMSTAEVAEITGKPVGAVKSLQHRGLKALQRRLIPKDEGILI